TVRSWLFSAVFRYCEPESTCSAQSRRKSTPKTPSATTPRMATRSAIRGVNRQGSSMRGSGGMKRRDGTRDSTKQPHLLRLEPLARAEEPAHERIDGGGQEEAEEHARQQPVDENRAGGAAVAQEGVQEQRTDGVEDGDDEYGEVQCVAAVA